MSIKDDCPVDILGSEKLMNSLSDETQTCIEFSNITYAIRKNKERRKLILDSVAGYFLPGKLTAIIGPSGAGKTSLLNVISGRKRHSNSDGSVTVNGVERDIESFRKRTCFVPQDFALMNNLTVKETLLIATRLKLGKFYDKNYRKNTVYQVAKKLGLIECFETLTQNLSGGEKKRLSIGVEVITNPTVLLLDEPTSGLDSSASNQVVNLLHTIARTGCTVACTIHQPSSRMISQFDDVIVLSQGKCYYCGSQEEIFDVFNSAGFTCPKFYNISEFVLEVIAGERGGDLDQLREMNFEKYTSQKSGAISRNSHINRTTETTDEKSLERNFTSDGKKSFSTGHMVPFTEQLEALFLRASICIKRDNTLTKLRFAAHILVAILLGIIFYNFGQDAAKTPSNISCIFFFVLFLFFANSMPAVQMFPAEAAVFLQENRNNWYTLPAYHIMKVFSDLPLQILCSSTFLFIAYPLTGQPMDLTRMFLTWSVCTLTTILAQSFGMVTGAAFSTQMGMFLVPAFNIPVLLFSGFFLKLSEVPVYLRFFSVMSYFRWAFEGSLQAIYGSNRSKLSCSIEYCYKRDPVRILAELDMPSVSFDVIITILILWIVFLHAIIYSILRFRVHATTK